VCTLRGDGKGGRLGEGARDVGIGDVCTRDVCFASSVLVDKVKVGNYIDH